MPQFSLAFDNAGNLYGATNFGGAYDYGAAFELTPRGDGVWAASRVYSYTFGAGGFAFAVDDKGNAFGETLGGNQRVNGNIYRLAPHPNGRFTETILYTLRADGSDGEDGWGTLTLYAVGNLYGVTLA
jgi:hypothetical protein